MKVEVEVREKLKNENLNNEYEVEARARAPLIRGRSDAAICKKPEFLQEKIVAA